MDDTVRESVPDGAEDKLFRDLQSIGRDDDALQTDYSTRQVVRRIWDEHLRPRIHVLVIAGVAMILSAAMTGAVPFVIQRAADDIFTNQDKAMVYTITLAVIVITLFKTVSEYISTVAVDYLGNRFIAEMRIRMFERLVRADLRWIEDIHSGRFISSFLNDAVLIRQTASKAMLAYGESILKVIVLTGAMFWMDWRLAALIVLCMPLGIFLLGRQQRKTNKSTKKSLQETGDLTALISQTLRSIRVVRAFRQDQKEINRAKTIINRTLEFTMRGSRAKALANPIAELLTGIGLALAIYYAGTQGLSGQVSLGEFMGFMAAAMLLFQPLRRLALIQTSLQEGVAAASRVFGIIDREAELRELPDAPD
ncbi:MAG: ABC transporter transmembrane domain-containing protein, partial [Methyloligellaceae bacterium]